MQTWLNLEEYWLEMKCYSKNVVTHQWIHNGFKKSTDWGIDSILRMQWIWKNTDQRLGIILKNADLGCNVTWKIPDGGLL